MSQLRHLHSRSIYLNSPPKISPNDVKYRVLENLQSVSGLSPCCCTKEIFQGIKKVKQLGISNFRSKFSSEPKCLDNLIYLHELEALSIVSYSLPGALPSLASFPPNLKKLTLCETFLMCEDMAIISKLPKLEVLQLKADAFVGSVDLGEAIWEVTDMGFPELKSLLLEGLSLDHWRATDDFFPCLECIIIRNCLRLKEIPEGFADSMTLQLIELHRCYPILVNSAERIRKEQLESLGNEMLKVVAFDTIREVEAEEEVYAFDTITNTEYLPQLAIVRRDSDGEAAERITEKADEYSEKDTKCCGNLFSCFNPRLVSSKKG